MWNFVINRTWPPRDKKNLRIIYYKAHYLWPIRVLYKTMESNPFIIRTRRIFGNPWNLPIRWFLRKEFDRFLNDWFVVLSDFDGKVFLVYSLSSKFQIEKVLSLVPSLSPLSLIKHSNFWVFSCRLYNIGYSDCLSGQY